MGRQTSCRTLGFCRNQHGNAGLNPCSQNVLHGLQHPYLQAPAQTNGIRTCTLTSSGALCTVKPEKPWCKWCTGERPCGTSWDIPGNKGRLLVILSRICTEGPRGCLTSSSIGTVGQLSIRLWWHKLRRHFQNQVCGDFSWNRWKWWKPSGFRFWDFGEVLHLYLHLQSQEPGPHPPTPEKLNCSHWPAYTPSADPSLVTWPPRFCSCLPVELEWGDNEEPLARLCCVVGEISDSGGARPSSLLT